MSILEDISRQKELDPDSMYINIYEFPEQLAEAQKIGAGWKVNRDEFIDIANITLTGMGGSAIGGDLLRSYVQTELQLPFQVNRNYSLPEYVDDESLVIVSSYSGNTEETLSALADALERKAMIAAITTGGKVAEIASEEELTVATLPGGMQPRAALAFSFVPLLYFLEQLGFTKETDLALTEAIGHLRDRRDEFARDTNGEKNKAKSIAQALHGKLPLIYSGPDLTEPIAVRWRGQISENGKSLAYSSVFPEMNHNELVGWSGGADLYRENFHAVLLRDSEDNDRVGMRMDLFAKTLKDSGVPYTEVESTGENRLSRMLSLIQIGDFVSYYLAMLNEVDPTPVEAIEALKAELAEA